MITKKTEEGGGADCRRLTGGAYRLLQENVHVTGRGEQAGECKGYGHVQAEGGVIARHLGAAGGHVWMRGQEPTDCATEHDLLYWRL